MAASITTTSSSRRVARIVGRIVAASDQPEQPYRITILNAPAVNAFALPGGYLYVTRGLLALANDSSEVAAVLAHEMAHVTANHAIERQNKARNAVIVSRVVTDVLSDDDAAGRLALASSQRSLASFSRQQELEADAIGVKTIGRAGYDPFAAARFLAAMARFSRLPERRARDRRTSGRTSSPRIHRRRNASSSRPAPPAQFGAPGIGEVDRDRYLAGIDGMIFGDDPSQGYVRDRTFVHPSLGVGFTVPDGFVIDNTSDAVLATGADGTALRFDAVALAAAPTSANISPRAGSTAWTRAASGTSPSTACPPPRRAPTPRAGSSRSPSCRQPPGRPTASSSPTR